jgi:lysophospholipase L1-like esterase
LLIISLGFSLFVAELVLQRFSVSMYYVLPPGLKQEFNPVPDTMPGVSGQSVFSVNAVGTRGTDWSDDHRLRILAVGGSTTECLYLDDSEAWPHLLEQRINEELGAGTAWVGNVGRSGHNTRNHILQVEKLLGQLPDIDLLILLIGINDLALRLLHESDFVLLSDESRKYRQKLFYRSFALIPPMVPELPFFQRLAIWQQTRKFKKVVIEPRSEENRQDTTGEIYKQWRSFRQQAPAYRDELPDLSSGLNEYAQNIDTIIELARRHDVHVMLVTQPSLYKEGLEKELADLLWFGGVDNFMAAPGSEYYSISAMQRGLDQYNEVLLSTCDQTRVSCVDLAAQLPKDTSVFYDDVHLNESGARKVAEILADAIMGSDLHNTLFLLISEPKSGF